MVVSRLGRARADGQEGRVPCEPEQEGKTVPGRRVCERRRGRIGSPLEFERAKDLYLLDRPHLGCSVFSWNPTDRGIVDSVLPSL